MVNTFIDVHGNTAARWHHIGCVYHHFSGVELYKVSKRLSGWFLQMINAKLFWLGGYNRLSETPKKVRSDTRLSQKHVSVEMINAKLFWNAFISPTDLRKGVCPTWSLLYGSNCAMQLHSDKAFLSTLLTMVFDDKRNNSRKAFALRVLIVGIETCFYSWERW